MKSNKNTLDEFSRKKVVAAEEKTPDSFLGSVNFAAAAFTIVCVMALLIVRGALFPHESNDFLYALRLWINEYKEMTFLEGLGTKVGVYNLPYMYLLNIMARLNASDLVMVKVVSVFFDFLLAYFIMKIVALKTENINMHILAFILTLAIPTVIINSAMWGQCDSIYTAFVAGSIYFGLRGRSKSAYAFMALAVSFKLQAAFLLPIFPVLIFTKRISIKDCYMFFVVYAATALPALLAGMSMEDALFAYVDQVNYFPILNMNSVNIWRFVVYVSYESFFIVGLFMTGLVVLSLMYFTYINRERMVNTVDFVRFAYLVAVLVPFMLPKMHDRYFYMADILSVAVFLFDKRRWYVPVVTVACSYIAYAFYLMSGTVLIDYRYAAIFLLVVIIIVLRDYVLSLYPGGNSTVVKPQN